MGMKNLVYVFLLLVAAVVIGVILLVDRRKRNKSAGCGGTTGMAVDLQQIYSPQSKDQLAWVLLQNIQPKLQYPQSAQICSGSDLFMMGPDENGKFNISGTVDYQGDMGLMKRAKFNATAGFVSQMGGWCVDSVWLYDA